MLISAKTGQGLDQLRQVISQRIARLRHQVELVIPYDKGAVLSLIHQKGQVEAEEYTETGTKVTCPAGRGPVSAGAETAGSGSVKI